MCARNISTVKARAGSMHVLAGVRDSKITDHDLIEGTPEPRSAWAGSSCQRQNPADNSPRPLPGDGNVRVALFELPPETPRVLAFSRVASHMAQKSEMDGFHQFSGTGI